MLDSIIPDYAYWWVYYIFTLVLVISMTTKNNGLLLRERGNNGYHTVIFIGIMFIIFFGLRPTSGQYMADTEGYAWFYNAYMQGTVPMEDVSFRALSETLWRLIENTMAGAKLDVSLWFLVVATIYISFNIIAIRRIFRGQEYAAFLFFITFFMFYSGGINGIRNACGYSIALFAMTFYNSELKNKYVWMAVTLLAGYLFHSSVIILIAGVIGASTVVKTTKKALLIWCAAIVMSLLFGNTLANFLAGFSADDRVQRYLQNGENAATMAKFAHTGFRWDFLLFSALPIYVGYYVTVVRGIKDRFYQFLLNSYILANAVWVVFIYAAYCNRYAALSWCLYPFVLYYPFAKFRLWSNSIQNNRALILLWMMLAFTALL